MCVVIKIYTHNGKYGDNTFSTVALVILTQ